MKNTLIYIVLLWSTFAFSQADQLAQNYFDRSDFEKALISYEELLKTQPYNTLYFQRKIECYQQLSQFDRAEQSLSDQIKKTSQPHLLVELGYNYQLQNSPDKAKDYYEQA